jgi:hypothetical protein
MGLAEFDEADNSLWFIRTSPRSCASSQRLTGSLARSPELTDRLSKLPAWPQFGGAADGRSFQPEGFLRYPIPSQRSYGSRFPGLANLESIHA